MQWNQFEAQMAQYTITSEGKGFHVILPTGMFRVQGIEELTQLFAKQPLPAFLPLIYANLSIEMLTEKEIEERQKAWSNIEEFGEDSPELASTEEVIEAIGDIGEEQKVPALAGSLYCNFAWANARIKELFAEATYTLQLKAEQKNTTAFPLFSKYPIELTEFAGCSGLVPTALSTWVETEDLEGWIAEVRAATGLQLHCQLVDGTVCNLPVKLYLPSCDSVELAMTSDAVGELPPGIIRNADGSLQSVDF